MDVYKRVPLFGTIALMETESPKKRGRLVYWRRAAKMSQDKAAEAIGVHRQTIVKLEKGLMSLTEEYAEKLGSAYGCDSWELLESAPLLSREAKELVSMLSELDPVSQKALKNFVTEIFPRYSAGIAPNSEGT